jgi:hypothetical protein
MPPSRLGDSRLKYFFQARCGGMTAPEEVQAINAYLAAQFDQE